MTFSFDARLFRAADRLAGKLPLLQHPLRGEKLLRIAQERTDLTDFGDDTFQVPLEILLRDYHQTANLSLFGKVAARWDVLRFLSNLLRLQEEERKRPEILQQRINRPIFITGLPRSGSTFLHNLLAQDSATLAPLCWETIFPCPRSEGTAGGPPREARQADNMVASFNRLAPELKALHPMTAFSPQECSEITSHVFRSPRFLSTHRLAEYAAWLGTADHAPAYQFHKRFLQHLQARKGSGRWVVKCPEHIFSLGDIRTVYPGARFVFMHRDPFDVLRSVAKLTEVLREPFTRQINRVQIGQEVSEFWVRGADLLIDADARPKDPSSPILNIQYRQLVNNPLGTVRELYRYFGLPLSEETVERFTRFIDARPNGGYGRARYRPEAFGLSQQAVTARFRHYTEHFAVETEGSSDAPPSYISARQPPIVATT